MKQVQLITKVVVPDELTDYEVEEVFSKVVSQGLLAQVGVQSWTVGYSLVQPEKTVHGMPESLFGKEAKG